MTNYLHKVNLINTEIVFQELNLKQYINLLKSLFGENVDPEAIFINTNNILKQLTLLPENTLKQINFVDYILLLIYIRIISIGDTIFINLQQENTPLLKIELQLDQLITNINNKIVNLKAPNNFDNYTITLGYPCIDEILYIEKNSNFLFYNFFIKKITTKDKEIILTNFSYKDRDLIIQKLPVKTIATLNKIITEIIDQLNTIDLLDGLNILGLEKEKKLPFTANSKILSFIVKLIFNNSLENIYDNIFILAKAGNLQSDFLYNCTPGEFFLFVKKLEEFAAKQQSNTKQTDSINKEPLPPIDSEADFDLE
jgi:hypothetical protein